MEKLENKVEIRGAQSIIRPPNTEEIIKKINELVQAVNELKEKNG